MEISTRDLLRYWAWASALLMVAFSGAMAELFHLSATPVQVQTSSRARTLLTIYLIGMVVLAWLAVLSGAYIVYPWYRAVPPAGVTDLSDYPRRLLLSSGTTSEWHNVGMEWKETWRGLRQSP